MSLGLSVEPEVSEEDVLRRGFERTYKDDDTTGVRAVVIGPFVMVFVFVLRCCLEETDNIPVCIFPGGVRKASVVLVDPNILTIVATMRIIMLLLLL